MLGIRSSLIFWYVCIPDIDQSVCQSVRAFPLACRVLAGVRAAVREHAVQEAVPLLLQQVLQHLPVRAVWVLRQQGRVPLLQQLEDQARRPKCP